QPRARGLGACRRVSRDAVPAARPGSRRGRPGAPTAKIIARPGIAVVDRSQVAPKTGCRVASRETAMDIHSPVLFTPPEHVRELDRLGDQIAELSAHVEAATARLLDLIRA